MNLFRCQTIAQFKIMSWLAAQGITQEDIARMDLLSDNRLRVINPAGQYLELTYNGEGVSIDQPQEEAALGGGGE